MRLRDWAALEEPRSAAALGTADEAKRYLPPRQHRGHDPDEGRIKGKVILEGEKGSNAAEKRPLPGLAAAPEEGEAREASP